MNCSVFKISALSLVEMLHGSPPQLIGRLKDLQLISFSCLPVIETAASPKV